MFLNQINNTFVAKYGSYLSKDTPCFKMCLTDEIESLKKYENEPIIYQIFVKKAPQWTG